MRVGMASRIVLRLKALFFALFCFMLAVVVFTIYLDGFPFPDRSDVFTPWFAATLVDFYINIVPIAVWISYKESNWFRSISWIILLLLFGSFTTCAYVFLQLLKLTPEECSRDPMYYLLLRDSNKDSLDRGRNSPIFTARVVFGALGCLMLGTLLYTTLTDGSPFRKDLLYPWMVALLVNFYIVVVALSAWVLYKEASWVTGILWVILLICLGSISTSVYIVVQLLRLSAEDPLYLVLLNSSNRCKGLIEEVMAGQETSVSGLC